MTIESTLHAWAVAGSGVAADRVIWRDQGNPRPAAGPWVSLKIIDLSPVGIDWVSAARNPLVIADDTVESVDTTANTLTLTAHGLVTGDGPVRLTTTGALPGGLAIATDYWIIRASADAVQLAASFLGAIEAPLAPIDLTSAGTGTHTLVDTDETVRAGIEVAVTTRGVRTGTLSVQCYGGAIVGDASAHGVLERLRAAHALPSSLRALDAGGVGIGSFEAVQDVSAVLQPGTAPESRAAMTVRFHVAARAVSENDTVIETVVNDGTVT